ncbi:hypothetical protein GCM10022200_17960 [Microbacterium awajiense]|uniref:Uncharacterized protein n=1 Tax=Microbacterium awajiense TaxID=415214 RepID=A0ABP7AM00_9MICO
MLRALLVAVIGAAAISPLAGLTLAGSHDAVAGESIVCADFLDAELAAAMEQADWEQIEISGPFGWLAERGGLDCVFGLPQSDFGWWTGYAPAPDEEELRTFLADAGFADGPATAEGAVLVQPGPTEPTPEFDQVCLLSQGLLVCEIGSAEPSTVDSLVRTRNALLAAGAVAPEPTAEPIVEADPAPVTEREVAPAETPTGGLADGPAAPSTLSGLRTPAEVDLRAGIVACTIALTLVFAAILAFPGKLMESAIQNNSERVSTFWRPVTALAARVGSWVARALRRWPRWILLSIGLVVAAVISGFVDPEFGFNAGSVRMLASSLVALVVDGLLVALLVAALARRWGLGGGIGVRLAAGSFVILAVSVLLSRLTGFVPGVIFGVIIAVTLPAVVGGRDQLRIAASETGYLLGIGVVSWFAYGALAEPLTTSGGIIDRFVIEALSAITVIGLSALPVLLLPFRGLPGGSIFSAGKIAWGISYIAAGSLFMVVLLPFPGSWEQTSAAFWVWVGLFVAYALVAIALWFILSRPRADVSEDETGPPADLPVGGGASSYSPDP